MSGTKRHLLICSAALLVLLIAAPAQAISPVGASGSIKWTVGVPHGTPFTKCTVYFGLNDHVDLQPGGASYTYSGNQYYVQGQCYYQVADGTVLSQLMIHTCDGADWTASMPGTMQCTKPEIRLRICRKQGTSSSLGDYTFGFCER